MEKLNGFLWLLTQFPYKQQVPLHLKDIPKSLLIFESRDSSQSLLESPKSCSSREKVEFFQIVRRSLRVVQLLEMVLLKSWEAIAQKPFAPSDGQFRLKGKGSNPWQQREGLESSINSQRGSSVTTWSSRFFKSPFIL